MIAKTMTETNNGQTIELCVGDTVLIRLPETPTSGFRWELEPVPGLTLVSSAFQPPADTTIGGSGHRIFEMRMLRIGECRFQAKLWREWEGDASIRRRFQLTLRAAR